jgi:hypothetical protein
MRISKKRFCKLYEAISGPIMDARIAAHSGASLEEIDRILFKLDDKICEKVTEALKLTQS